MKISIGADHRGFALKQLIIEHLDDFEVNDVGAASSERSDYPVYANAVVQDMLAKRADIGILICGSGVGMSIAANRAKGIYAGLCWNPAVATAAKQDDGINLLVLPADFVTPSEALVIIDAWLGASFKGGRHQDRLFELDALGD